MVTKKSGGDNTEGTLNTVTTEQMTPLQLNEKSVNVDVLDSQIERVEDVKENKKGLNFTDMIQPNAMDSQVKGDDDETAGNKQSITL